jgi:hypothetical protein
VEVIGLLERLLDEQCPDQRLDAVLDIGDSVRELLERVKRQLDPTS